MTIIDKHEIEQQHIIQRNKEHLNQAQGITYTIPPMSTLLGDDSFIPFGEAILKGTADLNNVPPSRVHKQLFLSFKREATDTLIPNNISIT